VTPKLFIKQSKLKSLREELVSGKAVRNVTEVALDYGFTHLGRFSSDYRKMFGELPSETLRRKR
jgi:transcriptional regulator, AraC family